MPPTNPLPATDSAAELRPILGDDATATFENDPNFIDSNPAESGSSENLPEQRSASSGLVSRTADDDDEEDEDLEDDEDVDDEDDEDEDDDER